jgi:acylpyruvate hydrolase
MHITSFLHDGAVRYGANLPDGVIADLTGHDGLPDSIVGFLAAASAIGQDAVASAPRVARAQVRLLPVIPDPEKIICIGLNYADHASETGSTPPPHPTVFGKFRNALIAHGEAIVLPASSRQMDYEAELAVIIGRPARHVAAADALDYVAGYAPFNDVSARDYQGHTSQWLLGKSGDTFAPVGPSMVTADEIADPQNLGIRLSIGGEVLQEANTRDMIFPVSALIAYITEVMTLQPGDIIATGTPAGVGVARTPQRFLQPGESVRIEIEGMAALENPVAAEASQAGSASSMLTGLN